MKTNSNLVVVTGIIFACEISKSTGAGLWEFLVGPQLGSESNREEAHSTKTTEQLVKSYGYRLDTHLVASETGHILTLHRIPPSRNVEDKGEKRPVALVHHGLFGCSDMWLLRGPRHDLPYLLADSGYDVWLFNTRGNVHSRKHKFLNADNDLSYWDFGIEEMGYYDLPVTIDYILNITNQKDLHFIGHSIGASAGFITCILRPEYNEKIRLFVALAPLTNVRHDLTPFHRVIFSLGSILIHFSESMNVHEILPRRSQISNLVRFACEDGSPLQKLCLTSIFSIVGDDIIQLNTKTFPNFVRYYPAGTSLRVVANVIQYYLSGEFARNDFGSPKINFLRYNSTTPPIYDLSKVTVPVLLHYGPGDLLVTKEDIDDLAKRLPKVVGKYKVPHNNFNHLDFILASDDKHLLYDKLLNTIKKYKT